MTYPVYRVTVYHFALLISICVIIGILCLSRDTYASEIPVSQGKSAVASSVTGATYSASQAVDGFIHTKWLASNSQLPQWLTVDLTQNVHVSRVETVFEHVNSSYAYKIESSIDGINWSIFADRSANTAINFPFYTDSGDVLARFVRLQVVGVGSPGDQASVFDFRVYSTSEAQTLLSQNKTTAALSSFSGSWGSDKAVDGQLLTSWAPSSPSLPQWLVVDLGQLRNVQRFETTYANIQDIYGYKIDFSIDGIIWYTFTDRTGNMQAGDPRYVDEGNVTARYFRLTTTRVASGGYASLAEFQIYGPDGGLNNNPNAQTLTRVYLDEEGYNLQPTGTIASYLTGVYGNGNTFTIQSGATYRIANTAVATVNANGVITGVAAGSTTLTVTYNGQSTSANITVSTNLTNLNRIAFDSYSYSLQSGSTRSPYVIGYKNDSSTQTLTTGLTFTSSNPAVASVNSSGMVTGISPGVTTITAFYGSFTASASVNVTTTVSRIEADESTVYLEINGTQYLTINAYDPQYNITDVTSNTSFTSSNSSVVTVSSYGYITAVSAGSAIITATYNGISTTIYVTVGFKDILAPTWNYGANVTVTPSSGSSVTLTWSAATDNVGVTSYRIYKDSELLTTVSGSELTKQLSGLAAGINMSFKVEAGDEADNWSSSGPSVTYTLTGVTKSTDSQALLISSQRVREAAPDGRMLSKFHADDGELRDAFNAINEGSASSLLLQIQDDHDTTVVEFASSVWNDLQDMNGSIQLDMNAIQFTIPLLLFKNHVSEAERSNGLFSVIIRHEASQLAKTLKDKATSEQTALLLTNPIGFEIQAGGIPIRHYANMQVERSITLPGTSYTTNVTAVRLNVETGEIAFVPSILTGSDGAWKMVIKDQYGGLYTIIQKDKHFEDMRTHWAREDVEKLASKRIISGVDEQHFEPEKEISRAEFATLLIRALGIEVNESDPGISGFQDIKDNDWYSQMVNTAAKAGLIEGFEDGTFRPLLQVTREQMAAMINRTIQITGSQQVNYEQDTVLNPFIDQHAIDNWARQAMAFTLQTGLIQGVTETQLNPNAFATRAQAAVMLKRLLIYLQYIN
ncbi:discoidin domain-containing protein [Paenibacillus sp. LjRoot56]|uniref:discoidin domain-containing protein n=1 Tax=Paenibacillus sp. LjRoot56 TaxID=3342333 RepID=UPI003ECCED49